MDLAQINFGNLYGELQKRGFKFSGVTCTGTSCPPTEPKTLGGIISVLLPYLYAAAGIFLLLYLIYAGFSYMLAAGDQKKVQEARARLTNALIGFLVVFLSYLLVQALGKILGIPSIQEIFQ